MTVPIGLPDRFGATLQAPRLESPKLEAPSIADLPSDQKSVGQVKFADQLKNFVADVNEYQKTGETKTEEFAQGRSNDIHGTMIAVEQAEISLRLLGNVRNRVIEMYREVMRMGS